MEEKVLTKEEKEKGETAPFSKALKQQSKRVIKYVFLIT